MTNCCKMETLRLNTCMFVIIKYKENILWNTKSQKKFKQCSKDLKRNLKDMGFDISLLEQLKNLLARTFGSKDYNTILPELRKVESESKIENNTSDKNNSNFKMRKNLFINRRFKYIKKMYKAKNLIEQALKKNRLQPSRFSPCFGCRQVCYYKMYLKVGGGWEQKIGNL